MTKQLQALLMIQILKKKLMAKQLQALLMNQILKMKLCKKEMIVQLQILRNMTGNKS